METAQSESIPMIPNCSHSAETDKLFAALVKAIPTLEAATKDAKNPHFNSKYADLRAIVEVARPALAREEIAILQPATAPFGTSGVVMVTTVLLHSSGQWLATELRMSAKDSTPQAMGSAITYARRYALSGLLGITTEDDDGNAASVVSGKKHPAKAAPKEKASLEGMQAKFRMLYEEVLKLTGATDMYFSIIGAAGYESAKDIPDLATAQEIYNEISDNLDAFVKAK